MPRALRGTHYSSSTAVQGAARCTFLHTSNTLQASRGTGTATLLGTRALCSFSHCL